MRKLYFLILIALSSHSLFAQTIRYVTPTGSGTGTGSWANASSDLQAMINASGSGDEVRVAAGIYKPTQKHNTSASDADRDKSFVLLPGVKVYGGFSGTNDNEGINDRNFKLNTSVLDGDLGGGNNAYHVVFSLSTLNTVLDGFTIRNGKADNATAAGAYERNQGGGIYLRSAGNGLLLKNLVLHDNISTGSGGAVFLRPSGSTTIWNLVDVAMYDNAATVSGGGVYVYTASGSPTVKLDRIKAYSNSCVNYGGAIYIMGAGSSSVINGDIKNSIFYNNSSTGGNDDGLRSGAIAFGSYTNMILINSTLYNNKSVALCGAVSFNPGSATTLKMYNNLFAKNSRVDVNGNFVSAFDMRNNSGAILDIRNNIFQKVALSSPGVDDTYANNIDDETTHNTAELFVSEIEADATFLMIKEGPATESGLNDFYNTADQDLALNERKKHTNVDIGAYEFQGTLPVNLKSYTAVKKGATSVLSWTTESEQNNQKFVVERGNSANNLTFFKEVAGAGDSSNPLNYSITDYTPLAGINYYRLKQIDKNGTSKILGIEAVNFELLTEKTSVYPNPARSYVKVKSNSPESIVSLNLISLTGKNILTNNYAQLAASEGVKLELADIPTGTYILWINKGKPNAEKQTLLVVK